MKLNVCINFRENNMTSKYISKITDLNVKLFEFLDSLTKNEFSNMLYFITDVFCNRFVNLVMFSNEKKKKDLLYLMQY